ncbi:two component transcriptional regulator, LuxR family [Microbispora rosea]|uniref:Two component transcriptional regulator, LuxR family n=1 Tax=Microbispora rosea TaxID=58117 RepID=A0A1N7GTP2_9ACTN|nr:response regulator transcription factor [Microbispora rosea]GIH51453.1 DNA-binding response regulator [Microbispora rosea subsp. rosea]SIS15961.1 two component transcriptional regulator, LuxR family [Microbispora rosea]
MIRVLIVDDEALVRSGLRMILEAAGDVVVVGEARDGEEAIGAAARLRPEVVLMDVRMPGMDGLTATGRLLRAAGPPKVVMVTTFDLDEYVHEALRLGAVGFLLKDTPPRELIAAVRTVAEGNAMLSPSVLKRLLGSFAHKAPSRAEVARHRLAALTAREEDVVRALARGLSNAEIGRELKLSEPTVKAHVSRLLAKLGLANRVQAAILVHDADLG